MMSLVSGTSESEEKFKDIFVGSTAGIFLMFEGVWKWQITNQFHKRMLYLGQRGGCRKREIEYDVLTVQWNG